jgi:hypothetical protein
MMQAAILIFDGPSRRHYDRQELWIPAFARTTIFVLRIRPKSDLPVGLSGWRRNTAIQNGHAPTVARVKDRECVILKIGRACGRAEATGRQKENEGVGEHVRRKIHRSDDRP